MWQRQEIKPEGQSHTLRLPDALCLMEEYGCEHVAPPGGGSGEALQESDRNGVDYASVDA